MLIYSRLSLQNFHNQGFWVTKNNALLTLIKYQDDTDKIYLYSKHLGKPKYEFLIKKRKDDKYE